MAQIEPVFLNRQATTEKMLDCLPIPLVSSVILSFLARRYCQAIPFGLSVLRARFLIHRFRKNFTPIMG
ncbi:MAG: hypothetical protein ABIN24_00395 [Dyadobacter sp.]